MIAIVDYGMGNLFSIQSALSYLGTKSTISSDPFVISTADKILLPGVGSFYKAMANLRGAGLDDAIKTAVISRKASILGICLGMQLMGTSSTEEAYCDGLGLIDSSVERFDERRLGNLKIPHVGFDPVDIAPHSKLFDGLGARADFYFTHSYRMSFKQQPFALGTCTHGETFIAAFEQGHICGTQFHPEKSQSNGLVLLKNFIEKF